MHGGKRVVGRGTLRWILLIAALVAFGGIGVVALANGGEAADEMFFYKSSTGSYRYYDIQPNASLGTLIRGGDSGYSLGWDSITAVDLDGDGQDEMFFYKSSTGSYRYYDIQPNASLGTLIRGGDSGYSLGWDSITAVDLDGDGQDEMFFYKSSTGSYRYYDIQPNASLGTLIRGGDSGYSLGWDSITAVDLDTPPPPTTTTTTTTTTIPTNPGDSKNCSDFSTWAAAQAWFDLYYPHYGDVANLDQDGDLIACESLPGAP